MIIVTGAVTARPESFEALLEASLAHVRRSRTEPGCIGHAVRIDAENPLQLVFFEEWSDRAAAARRRGLFARPISPAGCPRPVPAREPRPVRRSCPRPGAP